MSQNLRANHLFVTGKTGGAVGIPGVAQSGAVTINSDVIVAPRDKKFSIIVTVTKTSGTVGGTAKLQVSNATHDEVLSGDPVEQWVDETTLTAQTITDATNTYAFKITNAIFKRYRVNLVFASGVSTVTGRTAV